MCSLFIAVLYPFVGFLLSPILLLKYLAVKELGLMHNYPSDGGRHTCCASLNLIRTVDFLPFVFTLVLKIFLYNLKSSE